MTWNYRIIKQKGEHGEYFGIHEVFYKDEKPDMYTVDAIAPMGDSVEELRKSYNMMANAFHHDVLTPEDFVNMFGTGTQYKRVPQPNDEGSD